MIMKRRMTIPFSSTLDPVLREAWNEGIKELIASETTKKILTRAIQMGLALMFG